MPTHRIPRIPRCVSCGEKLGPMDREGLPYGLAEELKRRCWDCATEIVSGQVPPATTLQHGTGGGKRVIRDPRGLA